MRRHGLVALTVVALCACMQAGLGPGASGAGAFEAGGSPLDTALTLAPPTHGPDTYTFQFTNDEAIESALGYDFSRGATPAKFAAFIAHANAEGDFYESGPTQLWQGQDVKWESQAGTEAPNLVSVTALRAGVDLSLIERKLIGCKYRESMVDAIEVYSATIEMVIDCSGT
ncbi:MAG TPA: hypothetical protein VGM80_08235, partial [Gaiellaceae bacterium]